MVLGGAPSMHRREKSVDLVLVPFVKVLCSNAKKFALCTQKVTITLLGLDDVTVRLCVLSKCFSYSYTVTKQRASRSHFIITGLPYHHFWYTAAVLWLVNNVKLLVVVTIPGM